MKAHTPLWLPYLLRQFSKVPTADLAPGLYPSARAEAATGPAHRASCLATAPGSSFTSGLATVA